MLLSFKKNLTQASTLRTATGEAGSARAHEDINKQLADFGLTPVDQVGRRMVFLVKEGRFESNYATVN